MGVDLGLGLGVEDLAVIDLDFSRGDSRSLADWASLGEAAGVEREKLGELLERDFLLDLSLTVSSSLLCICRLCAKPGRLALPAFLEFLSKGKSLDSLLEAGFLPCKHE